MKKKFNNLNSSFVNDTNIKQLHDSIDNKLSKIQIFEITLRISRVIKELDKVVEKHKINANVLVKSGTLKGFCKRSIERIKVSHFIENKFLI